MTQAGTQVTNYSTFSKNRPERLRDSNLFRWLFNEGLCRCIAACLVKGEGLTVDADQTRTGRLLFIRRESGWPTGR